MDQTDRRDWAEARLFSLYERCFAELERDILRLDPTYRAGSRNTIWPHRFTREEFQSYLKGPVCNAEIRRCWLERILAFAREQENAELRRVLESILSDAAPGNGLGRDSGDCTSSPLRPPHFLAMTPSQRSGRPE